MWRSTCGRNCISDLLQHVLHDGSTICLLARRTNWHICWSHKSVWHKAAIEIANRSANVPISKVKLSRRYCAGQSTLSPCPLHVCIAWMVLFNDFVSAHILVRSTTTCCLYGWHVLRSRIIWGSCTLHSLLHGLKLLYVAGRSSRTHHRRDTLRNHLRGRIVGRLELL